MEEDLNVDQLNNTVCLLYPCPWQMEIMWKCRDNLGLDICVARYSYARMSCVSACGAKLFHVRILCCISTSAALEPTTERSR